MNIRERNLRAVAVLPLAALSAAGGVPLSGRVAVCFILLGMLVVCCGCGCRRDLYMGRDGRERDPKTGIMRGAESLAIDRRRDRAVLMLHGWLGNPSEFAGLPQVLDEAGWDVYAPLHRGHGTRPVDLEGVRARQLVADARDRFADLSARYDRVALLGFSMGGAIAAAVAAEQTPDRLVLVAPFFGVTYRWYYVLPARAWNAVLSPFIPYVESPVRMAAVNRSGAGERILTYQAFPRDATRVLRDLRRLVWGSDVAGSIRCPALTVYAPGDVASSPDRIREFHERLASTPKRTFVAERSNHHILHDWDADAAMEAIRGFMNE